MKVTLKNLLRHKFPMDEAEQAVLLKEISDLAKDEKWPDYGAKFVSTLDKLIKEILGETKNSF